MNRKHGTDRAHAPRARARALRAGGPAVVAPYGAPKKRADGPRGFCRDALVALSLTGASIAVVSCSEKSTDNPTLTPNAAGSATTSVGGANTAGTTSSGGATQVSGAANLTGGSSTVGGSGGVTSTDSGSVTSGSGGAGIVDGGMGGATTTMGTPGAGGCSDALVTDMTTETHDSIETVVNVSWTQTQAVDQVWLEFEFEPDNVMTSPPRPAAAGAQQEVVLGVPEDTAVSVRVATSQGGVETKTCTAVTHTTGTAPMGDNGVARPAVVTYEPDLASPNRWLLGSVSTGGSSTYTQQHWIYIIDRQGRLVWYQQVFAEGESEVLLGGFWPRIVSDGTHIAYDQQRRGDEGYMLFTTLDLSYQTQIHMPGIGDGAAVTDDGSVIYDDRSAIVEVDPNGQSRTLWQCDVGGGCYVNSVNYHAVSDSVVVSFPNSNQVVQLDRASGTVLRRFGEHADAYAFEPPDLGISFNHWAHISEWDTFIVSSHYPGSNSRHMWMEYEIDDETETLREYWIFETTDFPFPRQRGMVERLPSGHRLGNFGSEGVVAEVTEDKQVAWRVEFGRMVHNSVLIDDLYALNQGPP